MLHSKSMYFVGNVKVHISVYVVRQNASIQTHKHVMNPDTTGPSCPILFLVACKHTQINYYEVLLL